MEALISPIDQEELFAKALAHYREYNDKKSRDEIWMRVYEACKANAKRALQVSLDDGIFHDRLMTAVETCIKYIMEQHYNKKHELVPPSNPQKLITFCYLPTYAAFFGPKAVREDHEFSYEQSIENGYDKSINMIGDIIDENESY